MPSDPIVVRFHGPLSWLGNDDTACIFTAEWGKKAGIYLWTVETELGELVYYVGQTGRSFSVRMAEHFKEHFSGGYHLYSPGEFVKGTKNLLWPGRYDPERKTTVAEFVQNYDALTGPIEKLTRLYRFHVAPLECNRRLRERIEAGLANHLCEQEGVVGGFQDKGIRYSKRLDMEEPVQISLMADAILRGLPDHLWI